MSRGHSRGVPRATGPKSLCLCAFFLPERKENGGRHGPLFCKACVVFDVSQAVRIARFESVSESHDPKGPFRTKNTTAIAKIVNYYAVLFLLRPPNLVRRGPFLVRKNVCNSQETGVRTRCAAIANHPAVLKILRVVNLLRVVFFSTAGSFGMPCH